MDFSNAEEWPQHHLQESVQAYREKINKEMIELAPKINLAAEQTPTEEIWATVGDLRYGHPTTPLILRYRALMWFHMNPPDPRGEKMASRPGPYTVYIRRTDMMDVLGYAVRTIDRMLASVREATNKKPYDRITVELFCYLHKLPEDKIQQLLHELFLKKWNKIKRNIE